MQVTRKLSQASICGTVPRFPTVALHKESRKEEEDNKVTSTLWLASAEHIQLLHVLTNPTAASCDSCFPPVNSYMSQPRFQIHELGLIPQPALYSIVVGHPPAHVHGQDCWGSYFAGGFKLYMFSWVVYVKKYLIKKELC